MIPDHFTPLMREFAQEADQFLQQNPDIERIELLFPDLNGLIRGKWLPASSLPKLSSGAVRLPRSAYVFDVWGSDVPDVGLAQEVGDPDGVCLPVPGSLSLAPWADRTTAQVLMQMIEPGEDYLSPYDPRQVLQQQIDRFAAIGLRPVVASELEFYIVSQTQSETGHPQPAVLDNGYVLDQVQTYDMHAVDQIEALLNEIDDAGKAQRLPIDTTIAEVGPGQFEINLVHEADAMLAADQAILLKRVIKRVAHRHGLLATFMAKPYGEEVGSGMHIHASLLDEAGRNIFAAPAEADSANDSLQHAVGGLIATAADAQAIFAPHQNSYRRFQPDSFAPVTPCWGYDHRGAALRIPAISGAGARLEHRIAGADANPYLVVAAVLAGMHHGMEQQVSPGEPLAMDGDASAFEPLATEWRSAIDQFAGSNFIAAYFGEEYQRVYAACKGAEQQTFARTVTGFESKTYLHRL